MFAELTVAGLYTGVHQYTFLNSGDKKYLLFDITHSVKEVSSPNILDVADMKFFIESGSQFIS